MILSQTQIDNILELQAKMFRYFRVLTLQDLGVQTFDVLRQERWLQRCELVNDNTQRPDVTFGVIRLIFPKFWRTIERCTSLSFHHILGFIDFADIHIAKFDSTASLKENISRFNVPMNNIYLVQGFQSF